MAQVKMDLQRDKQASKPFDGFPEFVEKSMVKWKAPGLAVVVVKDGDVIYMNGFGLRDVEKQLPVTPQTLFAIGSCTKSFTAMAIGILVDEGKLDLDTPVFKYMPDFRLYDDYATLHATPRDLLCHRTGLPRYDSLPILLQLSREELYERFKYLKPNAGFREVFQYNSLMYMIAGVLISHITGSTWEEFVAERIFKPLGMRNSNFTVTDSQKADDFSQPYIETEGKAVKVPFRNIDSMGPAGSINSSVEDLGKWLKLHINGGKFGHRQLISTDSLEQMHSPQMAIRDPLFVSLMQTSLSGLGWFISHYRGHILIEHGGNIDGFSALVSLSPEDRIGVAVLTTSLNMLTHVIARHVYDRLLGLEEVEWNSHFKKVMARVLQESPCAAAIKDDESVRKPDTNPSLPLGGYVGTYGHPAFSRIEVTVTGDELAGELHTHSFKFDHFHFECFQGKGFGLERAEDTIPPRQRW